MNEMYRAARPIICNRCDMIASQGMLFRKYTPAPPLDQFVELMWHSHGYTPAHSRDRMMPSGNSGLVLNLRENQCRVYDRDDPARCRSSSGIVAVGPSTEYFIIDTTEQYSAMGVEFRPGGALAILGSPADLHGLHVSLEDLWGRDAADLRIQVLEAATPEARFRALERGLVARLCFARQAHPAVRFALDRFHATPGADTIASVTDAIGLSSRRFVQLFRDQVGLNPKLYCRVRRFRRVLQAIGEGRPVEWPEIALDAGYFDQAHFIHDFRSFSGISPSTYVASRPSGNHVPLE